MILTATDKILIVSVTIALMFLALCLAIGFIYAVILQWNNRREIRQMEREIQKAHDRAILRLA